MSAIPTGSFAPDSPSRMVPVRPPISRLPRTENMTAGSVGARAAPRTPAIVQSKSKKAWAKDRKSTRLNSSHSQISYAVFCLKKKKDHQHHSQLIEHHEARNDHAAMQ